MKERLFQEVFSAADVLGDGVGGVVTAAESRPLLGTQTPAVVAPTWVSTCNLNHSAQLALVVLCFHSLRLQSCVVKQTTV